MLPPRDNRRWSELRRDGHCVVPSSRTRRPIRGTTIADWGWGSYYTSPRASWAGEPSTAARGTQYRPIRRLERFNLCNRIKDRPTRRTATVWERAGRSAALLECRRANGGDRDQRLPDPRRVQRGSIRRLRCARNGNREPRGRRNLGTYEGSSMSHRRRVVSFVMASRSAPKRTI